MAARPFAFNAIAVGGGPESGALFNSYIRSTSTRSPLYTSTDVDPVTGPKKQNPFASDADGRILFYFDTDIQYTWRCTTADGATIILECDVIDGVLSNVTSETILIDASWVAVLNAPLGEGWADALANDFATESGSVDPADSGAAGDVIKGTDGVTVAADATFISASANYTTADIGKTICIHGAGTAGAVHVTTIASRNSLTSIELALAPVTSVASNATYAYGTDDTAALEAAAAIAKAAKLPLCLKGRTYGVVGDVNITDLDDLIIDGGYGTLLQLSPATGRKTLNVFSSDGFKLKRTKIDRFGNGTEGYAWACYVSASPNVLIEDNEFFGNGKGDGFAFINCFAITVRRNLARDIRYVHTAETDDQVNGFGSAGFNPFARITGNRAERMGRTDLTSTQRDRWSRGFSLGGLQDFLFEANSYYRVDQGFDFTGSSGNRNGRVVGCGGKWANAVGEKYANTCQDIVSIGSVHQSPGLYAITIAGPESPIQQMTKNVKVIAPSGSNVGANGFWGATDTVAFHISYGNNASPENTHPRNSGYVDSSAHSDTGASLFTASGYVSTLTSYLNFATGCKVSLTTTGTLPAGYSATMWVVRIPDTNTVYFTDSFIKAQDAQELIDAGLSPLSKVVTSTNGGVGNHTMTLVSLMYDGHRNNIAGTVDRTAANYFINPRATGYLNKLCSGGTPPVAIVSSAAQSIPNNSITALNPTNSVFDPMDLIDTATPADDFIAPYAGHWRLSGTGYFVGNATGVRSMGIQVDSGGGYGSAVVFDQRDNNGASLEVSLSVTYERWCAQGTAMRFTGFQTSGGGLNFVLTHATFEPASMFGGDS